VRTSSTYVQRDLFGFGASDSTVHRTFHELSPLTLRDLHGAVADVRAKVWDQLGLTASEDPVLLDIDASLVEIHSENKEGAAAHFKGGYGSTQCSVSPTPPARRSPPSYARATPGPTPWPITS
jgi:hypothetical protein